MFKTLWLAILLTTVTLCFGQNNGGSNSGSQTGNGGGTAGTSSCDLTSIEDNITNISAELTSLVYCDRVVLDLQEKVSAMFSTLNSVKDDVKTILRKINSTDTSDVYTTTSLPHSCEEIKNSNPNSVSDYYTIIDINGYSRHVYCNMKEVCGSDDGWMRVGYLNMSDSEENCPEGFGLYESNGVRACGRHLTYCSSTVFPSYGISYSEVCGKVIGYQYGSPNGAGAASSIGIDGPYIDGISLTHGSPRSHIWSYIGGLLETGGASQCPCGTIGSIPAPGFVGTHYYCEAAARHVWSPILYTTDPLWDGNGCGLYETACCNRPDLPWFHRQLSYSTGDNIELRVCGNSAPSNEDNPFSFYEIYVK